MNQMRTTLDHLFLAEPPWIHLGPGETERKNWLPPSFYSREGMNVCVRQLRGKKMRATRGLMDEFGAALQFFSEFGENWRALGECLEYLDEWLPADAYVLVIEDAQEVLIDEQPSQLSALLRTLHDVGNWWATPVTDNGRFSRGAVPFHVLLCTRATAPSEVERLANCAQEEGVPVRT